ncbi:FAD-dependent thymidylate synthase [Thermodesulfobacteriota bacterium]
MKVTLLNYTRNPEDTAAQAARLCYSPSDIQDIVKDYDKESNISLIKKILASGHHSVLEHVSFTFGIDGISRVTTHQLVRHRIASFSQQSQRYVTFDGELDFITPDTIKQNKATYEKYKETFIRAHSTYKELVEMGIPKEDARYILPNGAETKIVVTMNARALLHFFELRCCVRAQKEIRDMAKEMLILVKPLSPTIFNEAGPSCVGGPCPEGKMTCGNLKEVREEYHNL